MLLILSARAVSDDIALQFGPLPPSFLPLGSQRLFAFQAQCALGEPCYMTIPDDFAVPQADRRAIDAAGINLLPQSPRLSLTDALRDAIERIAPEGPLRILYGDTLVSMPENILRHPDMVAVQETTANYAWAYMRRDPAGGISFSDAPPQRLDSRQVVCGYYRFDDPALLAEACRKKTIVNALNAYNATRPLTCVDAERWLDFGHLPLYFQSKKDILVKRVFNELTYRNHMLVKRSDDTAKMRAEAHWFENLPQALQLHVPRYCGRDEAEHRAGYALEYLYAPLLSDLDVFGHLPLPSWLEIIQACFELLDKLHAISPPAGAPEASDQFAGQFFEDVIVRKTWSRLETYCSTSQIPLDAVITLNGTVHPPLRDVVAALLKRIPPTTARDVRLWHGDLFFGNMFYDFTAQRVLCIDPRGQLASGQLCLYGDLRYDLAKIAHSVSGQYDKILMGRSQLVETDPLVWQFTIDTSREQASIEEIFHRFLTERYGLDIHELLAMTALLFFSMLPLHHDRPEQQRHFLASGLLLSHRALAEQETP